MWNDLMFRLRAILSTARLDRDLDEELRFHVERQTEIYVQQGFSASEARQRALRDFGGEQQVREVTRDSRGVAWIEQFLRDAVYALRGLRRSAPFAAAAIFTLALGMAANTSLFQTLAALRLNRLPISHPEQLVQIHLTEGSAVRGSVNRDHSVTYRVWDQVRARQDALEGIFAWADSDVNLASTGEVRMARTLWVTGDYFGALGVRPLLGHLISPAEDRDGCGTPGAVISYGFWKSEFGGDPAIIGRPLAINSQRIEIIGVTPPGFYGLEVGRSFQIALPVCSISVVHRYDALKAGTFWWLTVMGRLRPGWTIERAAAEMSSISPGVFRASLPPEYPAESVKTYLALRLTAVPASAGISGLRNQYSDPLILLLAIAGLVLVITCANLANLMLARNSAREREIAVRLAMGASRSRLIRQLMTESLVIALAGSCLALIATPVLTRILVASLGTGSGTITLDLRTDWKITAFTGSLAVITSLLFGLAPALRSSAGGPASALKTSARTASSTSATVGLRRGLVVLQVALSLVLVAGAALFVRSLHNIAQAPTGFRQDDITIADLGFPRPHPERVNVALLQSALLKRIGAIPGIQSVADTTVVPISGNSWSNQVWMDGASRQTGRDMIRSMVSANYFRTLDIPLLNGRDFNDHDVPSAPKVAIVNEAFAREIARRQNPVGLRFHVEATPSTPETVYQIVGLVGNAKYVSLRDEFQPEFYNALAQDTRPSLSDQLLIRSRLPASALIPALRNAISEVDPEARYAFFTFRSLIEDSMARERLLAAISSAFALLAGLLSAVGIYGMIVYLAALKRPEIAIRLALGASRSGIARLILNESFRMLAGGLALGAAIALVAGRFARSLVYGVTPQDPPTLLVAAATLSLLVLIASFVPAAKAAALDPMSVLREE